MRKHVFTILVVFFVSFFSILFQQICVNAAGTGVQNESKANALKSLGLLAGTSKGFELDRKPSRIEGAVMLVRLLGKEEYAKQNIFKHPFTDVPSWANPYVAYMFESKLTKGATPTKYDSNNDMTPAQYITFVLRALGYSDSTGDFKWNEAIKKAAEVQLITQDEAERLQNIGSFLRDDLVGISYNALKTKIKNSNTTLVEKLVYIDKVVPEEEALKYDLCEKPVVIKFLDSKFEEVIREITNKPDGDILSSDVSDILYLNAEDRNITSIEGIQYFKNLKRVLLSYNKISDVYLLGNLKTLEEVSLDNCDMSDITFISGLPKLINLSIANNHIEDISALKGSSKLGYLFLYNNKVSDISPISTLINLRQLVIENNIVKDISPLKNMLKLNYLNISNNQISDISPLSEMVELTGLVISYNNISDIENIKKLTKLNYLDVSNNQISDIRSLQDIVNLTSLTANNNNISDISALNGLTKLDWLELKHNKISDLSPLKLLTGLKRGLSLGNNQISNISPLSEMINLEYLNLQSNMIRDITALKCLEKLKQLYLNSNCITDIAPLNELVNLQILDLSQNQVKDLTPLNSLIEMRGLNIILK